MNFSKLRSSLKTERNLIEAENMSFQVSKESILKTYSNESAKPRLEALIDEHNGKIKCCKERAITDIERWYNEKIGDFSESLLSPPSKTLMDILNVYTKRSNVSESELEVLIMRCQDNYQALKLCQEVGKNNGFDIGLSVDFEKQMEELKECKGTLKKIVSEMDKNEKELSFEAYGFFGNYDDEKSHIAMLCLELENVEALNPEVTRFEKAKAEIDDNILQGDIKKATKKAILLSRDLEDILTDEESEMLKKGDN